MSEALIEAAIKAAGRINDLLETIFENDDSPDDADGTWEIRGDLCAAYATLVEALSVELGANAHQLIQDAAIAEMETLSVILRAKGVM